MSSMTPGGPFGPLVLSIGTREARHFNSDDLENGNREKDLLGSTGPGTSAWRMEFSGDLDLEVLTYLRTPDGFLTAMQDLAPEADRRHRVAIFNPGSNRDQESTLRVTNPGERTADVVIEGVDDSGRSPGEPVRVSIPARASRSFTAQQLESGGAGLRGALVRRRRRQVAAVRRGRCPHHGDEPVGEPYRTPYEPVCRAPAGGRVRGIRTADRSRCR